MNENAYGVIHEVGDLGCGYTPLTEAEQKVLREKEEKSEEDK